MTRDEAITLCEYVANACPQQRFDKYTPNIWADILAGQGYTFGECRAAVIAIKRRQPFVDTSEIIAEVTLTRRAAAGRARRAELDAQLPPAISPPIAAAQASQRAHLKDPRPLRETIRAIRARCTVRLALPGEPVPEPAGAGAEPGDLHGPDRDNG